MTAPEPSPAAPEPTAAAPELTPAAPAAGAAALPGATAPAIAPGAPSIPPADGSAASERAGEPDEPERLATIFFFFLLVVSLGALGYLFSPFTADVILALVFAALTLPLYRRVLVLVQRPWLASALVSALIVVTVAVPTTFLVASLSAEAAAVFESTRQSVTPEWVQEALFGDSRVAEYLRDAGEAVGYEITPDVVRDAISAAAGTVVGFIYSQVNSLLGDILSALLHFVIIVAMVFYLLIDGSRLKRYVFHLSPLPDHHEELLAQKFGDVGRAILFGNGIGSVLQGFLGGVAMWAVGLPSAVLWGTVMSIFAFLPLVGISVVVIPATIYLAVVGKPAVAVGFFVFCVGEGLIIENVVKTRLIGSHMQMHDLLIFLSILGGIIGFGLMGILYGPLLVTLFLTLAELYQQHYKRRFMPHFFERNPG